MCVHPPLGQHDGDIDGLSDIDSKLLFLCLLGDREKRAWGVQQTYQQPSIGKTWEPLAINKKNPKDNRNLTKPNPQRKEKESKGSFISVTENFVLDSHSREWVCQQSVP